MAVGPFGGWASAHFVPTMTSNPLPLAVTHMDTKPAILQPQDPVAARLGIYVTRAGIALAAILFALSYLRG